MTPLSPLPLKVGVMSCRLAKYKYRDSRRSWLGRLWDSATRRWQTSRWGRQAVRRRLRDVASPALRRPSSTDDRRRRTRHRRAVWRGPAARTTVDKAGGWPAPRSERSSVARWELPTEAGRSAPNERSRRVSSRRLSGSDYSGNSLPGRGRHRPCRCRRCRVQPSAASGPSPGWGWRRRDVAVTSCFQVWMTTKEWMNVLHQCRNIWWQ